MRRVRLLTVLLLILIAALSFAENGSVQLNCVPSITVADGRSTVTISAYVRRPSGQAVPDGTQVLFKTNLGTFKDDAQVQTVNGVARVVLQTGVVPGTAKVTATVFGIGAITTMDLEFLSDRSLLSSAKEYVEIYAPGYMMFSLDQRILGAAGLNHGAKLRYREIEIEADDLQFNILTREVKAKKAHLKMGKVNQDFDELNVKLPARSGAGTTTINPAAPIAVTTIGEIPWVEPTHERFGLAAIHSGGVTPFTGEPDAMQFKFDDLSESTSLVSAKKAVVFPQKEIQFQKAEILVGGVKLMKMPLYVVDLRTSSPVLTDQMFQIRNNQPAINYPYYLSLRPGETSLLRISTGSQYGRTSGVDRGLSLNYELGWNRGDEFDGGLALTSMTSRNWDLNLHQYIRFDDRTSATAFLDVPEGKSIYGNMNFTKQFNGFGMNLSSSTTRTLHGSKFDTDQVSWVLEKDPTKVGKLPFRYTIGFNASANATRTSIADRSQSVMGMHLRTQLIPRKLDSATQLNGSFTISEQGGHDSINGLAYQANATISRQLFPGASALLSYDYLENGFSSGLAGRHQLSFAGQLQRGNFSSNISAVRGLDVDKFSLFADMGYQLGNLWRLSYSYTMDRYIGHTYVDYTAAIGFRIGYREIGLTYSGTTKHFGIQLLGAPIGN